MITALLELATTNTMKLDVTIMLLVLSIIATRLLELVLMNLSILTVTMETHALRKHSALYSH